MTSAVVVKRKEVSVTRINKIVEIINKTVVRKLSVFEQTTVTGLRKTCDKNNTEVNELVNKLKTLRAEYKTKKTEELRKKINALQREIRKVAKKTHSCFRLIFNIIRPAPTPVINESDVNIVKVTEVKITKLVKKVTVIEKTIERLTEKLTTVDETEKVVIQKKIDVLRVVVNKLTIKITNYREEVSKIVNPEPVRPIDRLPKELNKTEITIIKSFKKIVNVYIKKVDIIRKKIVVLEKKYTETVDKDERVVIRKNISVLKVTIKKIYKKIVVVRRNIINIEFSTPVIPRPRPTPRPITESDIKIVNIFVKKVT